MALPTVPAPWNIDKQQATGTCITDANSRYTTVWHLSQSLSSRTGCRRATACSKTDKEQATVAANRAGDAQNLYALHAVLTAGSPVVWIVHVLQGCRTNYQLSCEMACTCLLLNLLALHLLLHCLRGHCKGLTGFSPVRIQHSPKHQLWERRQG